MSPSIVKRFAVGRIGKERFRAMTQIFVWTFSDVVEIVLAVILVAIGLIIAGGGAGERDEGGD
jgi:hypothetical protein